MLFRSQNRGDILNILEKNFFAFAIKSRGEVAETRLEVNDFQQSGFPAISNSPSSVHIGVWFMYFDRNREVNDFIPFSPTLPKLGGELPEGNLGVLFAPGLPHFVSHRLVTFDEGDGDTFALVRAGDRSNLDGVGHCHSPWVVVVLTLLLRQNRRHILNILKIFFTLVAENIWDLARYNMPK